MSPGPLVELAAFIYIAKAALELGALLSTYAIAVIVTLTEDFKEVS